jgi:GNAT superfamily N-acetyltransferase
MTAVDLRIEPVGPQHVGALRALFEASSSACFCRYWHFTGTKNEWLERCALHPEENADEMAAAIEAGDATGRGVVAVLDREDGEPIVGWMKLTARDAIPKLRALPVYRALALGSGATTFGIGCLLVRPDFRRRGVARALITAAERVAAGWGASAVEAYPRRSAEPLHPEEAWQGPERVFRDAGYRPIHDDGPYPVYAKDLAATGSKR